MTDYNNCKKNETTIDECNEVLVPRKYFEKLKSIQLAVDNLFSAIHKGELYNLNMKGDICRKQKPAFFHTFMKLKILNMNFKK